MILVIGGYAAGKRQYVRDALGYSDAQMSNQIADALPVFYGLESQPDTPLEQLLQKDVVICDEIGGGLVPMDKDERLFQEMWRTYFHSIAIKERLNPRLHRQNMPARFWPYMPEKA